jgi:hypothetical protein
MSEKNRSVIARDRIAIAEIGRALIPAITLDPGAFPIPAITAIPAIPAIGHE